MKSSFVIVGIAAMIWNSTIGLGQNTSPAAKLIIGTWKQNMEKSTYNPGPPPPKGVTTVRQYAVGEDGSVVAVTMNLDSQGLPSLGAVAAANYDEREYVQHTLATLATSLSSHVGPHITRTIAYKPIDSYTVQIIQRQDGDVVSVSTRTISADGKTMTERYDYTNAQNQRVTNVLIFEKQ